MLLSPKPVIVFITPPVTLEERYGSLASSGNSTPCLAGLILAAIVREAGYSVAVIDASAENLTFDETIARIGELSPGFIGITSTTLTILSAERVSAAVKKQWPDILIGIGGPHVTAIPEETLRRCADFDFVALHEGEHTIIKILDYLQDDNLAMDSITGIAFLAPDGRFIKTSPAPQFKDLDNLPFPAWDLLKNFPDAYSPGFFKVAQMPSVSFVSARGCPYHCSFCDTSVFGQKVRSHSAEYMVELFEYLNSRFGIRDVTFEDDTFMFNRRNVLRFCELLLQKNLGMTWACNSRLNLAKPEILQAMNKGGCWHISYGVESGSQDILDQEDKGITIEQIHQGIQNTRDAGIAAKGFFIVGHPGETLDTLQATYDLTRTIPFSDISVSCMTPFPGSPLSRNAHEFGAFDDDWTKMNLLTPVFVPHGLTADDLQSWQKKILRDFYFRPKTVLDYIGRILRNPSPRYIKGIAVSALALSKTVFAGKSKSTSRVAKAEDCVK